MRIALVAVTMLAGCPSPSPSPPRTTQRTTSDGSCEEIAWSCVGMRPGSQEAWGCIEGNASQTAQYQASCTPDKDGRFALGPCPRDDLAGGCTVARGSQCTTTWYLPPATLQTVAADCAKLGAQLVVP